MTPEELAAGAKGLSPESFSFLNLIMEADIVVQIVMVGLIFSSVWSWAIIFEKLYVLRSVRRATDRFEQVFWSGQSLEELYQTLSSAVNTSTAALFVAAMREWKRSQDGRARNTFGGLQVRLEKVMDVTMQKEMAYLERRLLFLATVGSTAPFVGLFGTVWGIMNAFQAIAASKNTNLAVVAPGIAEALFATALGLLAAVPAVIAYNKLSSDAGQIGDRMEGFSDEFSAIISRQIDAQG